MKETILQRHSSGKDKMDAMLMVNSSRARPQVSPSPTVRTQCVYRDAIEKLKKMNGMTSSL